MARKDKKISVGPIYEKYEKKSFFLEVMFTKEGFLPDIGGVPEEEREQVLRRWQGENAYEFLYQQGLLARPSQETLSVSFLLRVTDAFFRQLTKLPELEKARGQVKVPLTEETAEELFSAVPFAIGAEYITREWMERMFFRLNRIFSREIAVWEGTAESYFLKKSPVFRVPLPFLFCLAEKNDPAYPFRFFVAYGTLTEGKIQYMPLSLALEKNSENLQSQSVFLQGLARAAAVSPWVDKCMETGELLYPLRLTKEDAYEFLQQSAAIEEAGILCKVPDWWRKGRMTVKKELHQTEKRPDALCLQSELWVCSCLAVDGEPLSKEETEELAFQKEGLQRFRNQWVEIHPQELRKLQRNVKNEFQQLSLLDILRLSVGVVKKQPDSWRTMVLSHWLLHLLADLNHPKRLEPVPVPQTVRAALRPYQQVGYTWLCHMDKLGLGAYLGDDIGLGKRLQVLSYFEKLRTERKGARVLLAVSEGLVEEWKTQIEKYVPQMDYCLLHDGQTAVLREKFRESQAFLTIVTYKFVRRIAELRNIQWDCIAVDESKYIRKPECIQAETLKPMRSRMRIVMTGAPVEKNLIELWSVFDFLNRGLLGTQSEFRNFFMHIRENPLQHAQFRRILESFLLCRRKQDLQAALEVSSPLECIHPVELSKRQIVLYRKVTGDMKRELFQQKAEHREKIISDTLANLRRILNHPSQYLRQAEYLPEESGKFVVLQELCQILHDRREKVVVVTYQKEIVPDLADFLRDIFFSRGKVFDYEVEPAEQEEIVEAFCQDFTMPFLLFAVKEEMADLRRTKADHIIFFDGIWEKKEVDEKKEEFPGMLSGGPTIHKLICTGTIEERPGPYRQSEKNMRMSGIVQKACQENWMTTYSDEDIFRLFRLEQRRKEE